MSGAKTILRYAVFACVLLACFPGRCRAEGFLGAVSSDADSSTSFLSQRHFKVRINPYGIFFGIFGGSVEVGDGELFDIGPSFQWFQSSPPGRTEIARQFGLNTAFYFLGGRTRTSYLLRAGVFYVPVEFPAATQVAENHAVSLIFARQWIWRPGFMATLGAGATYRWTPHTYDFEPAMEWSVGWAF